MLVAAVCFTLLLPHIQDMTEIAITQLNLVLQLLFLSSLSFVIACHPSFLSLICQTRSCFFHACSCFPAEFKFMNQENLSKLKSWIPATNKFLSFVTSANTHGKQNLAKIFFCFSLDFALSGFDGGMLLVQSCTLLCTTLMSSAWNKCLELPSFLFIFEKKQMNQGSEMSTVHILDLFLATYGPSDPFSAQTTSACSTLSKVEFRRPISENSNGNVRFALSPCDFFVVYMQSVWSQTYFALWFSVFAL